MFVYFCQHLTVIIVNHSHTCLSLKIVLTLPRRLFPVITAPRTLSLLPAFSSYACQSWFTFTPFPPPLCWHSWVLPEDLKPSPSESVGFHLSNPTRGHRQLIVYPSLRCLSAIPLAILGSSHRPANVQGLTSTEKGSLRAKPCLTCGTDLDDVWKEVSLLRPSMNMKTFCLCFGLLCQGESVFHYASRVPWLWCKSCLVSTLNLMRVKKEGNEKVFLPYGFCLCIAPASPTS